MVSPSRWDRQITWVLGYILPWVCALGLAWVVCSVGARLRWWEPGIMDQSVRDTVFRMYGLPLGIFGFIVLAFAAWRLLRGSNKAS